jgi:hypothetical protein
MPLPSSISIMVLVENPSALLPNTPRKGGFAGAASQASKPKTKTKIKCEMYDQLVFMSSTLFLSRRGGNWKNRGLEIATNQNGTAD